MVTVIPAEANRLAKAKPIPLAAPVTTATFPVHDDDVALMFSPP